MKRLTAVAVCAFLASCSDAGPKRHRLSGAVTLDGQPIPFGEVVITPDGTKKNSGPQGVAPIKDGKFDTAADGGRGIGGGAVIVRVNGMSGPGGKTLCEYEFAAELPGGDSTKDIDVPKKDAHNANKGANKAAPEI